MTASAGRDADYVALFARLGLGAEVAYDEKWSAAPDFLGLIADHVLAARPATLVECSSGVSTVILARCCALNGRGRVYSLENGPEFAAATRAELARHGLDAWAVVIDAPLTDWRVDGGEYRWYGLDGLPETAIDMLVVDGPPGFLQRHSRRPALPLLRDRLTAACAVFLDDAARADEQEIVAAWLARYPEFILDRPEAERGCAVLRLDPGTPMAATTA